MPPLNNDFESNVPQLFILDSRTFVAKSGLSRLRAFWGALLAKIWWEGARKHFKGTGVNLWCQYLVSTNTIPQTTTRLHLNSAANQNSFFVMKDQSEPPSEKLAPFAVEATPLHRFHWLNFINPPYAAGLASLEFHASADSLPCSLCNSSNLHTPPHLTHCNADALLVTSYIFYIVPAKPF